MQAIGSLLHLFRQPVQLCTGFVSGHTLVVDGGAWMWRKPLLPREAVLKASRGVESKSRTVGVGGASKL